MPAAKSSKRRRDVACGGWPHAAPSNGCYGFHRGDVMQLVAILGVVVWFALNAALWYVRPGELIWLLASASLGIIFFAGFLWYLARSDNSRKL